MTQNNLANEGSANAPVSALSPELELRVRTEVALRTANYHNKAVLRGKAVIPISVEIGEAFGVCEALLIQQIHFWCTSHGHLKSGYRWCRNTYTEWASHLRMFSERSIERALRGLAKQGVVVTGVFNKKGYDRTRWYRLDYEKLCAQMASTFGGDWLVNVDGQSLFIKRADHAAKSVPSESTHLAPPIPESTETKEIKEYVVFSKQAKKPPAKDANSTTKPVGKSSEIEKELEDIQGKEKHIAVLLGEFQIDKKTSRSSPRVAKSRQALTGLPSRQNKEVNRKGEFGQGR